jgi:hypothetical protein
LDESDSSISETDEKEPIFGELEHLLRNAKEIGDTSFSDEATQLPAYPGLELDDFGIVSLPLNPDSAQKLIEIYKNYLFTIMPQLIYFNLNHHHLK